MAFPIGWRRVCPLVIPRGQVLAGSLANFPVLITAACLPAEMVTLGGTNAAQSDGGDIRFSLDAAGLLPLACDLTGWVQNATPASATAEIHVAGGPMLYGDRDNVIYVWYHAASTQSQPAANSTYGSQAVWSGYGGVWHFGDGTTLSLLDSTAHGNTGTNHGAAPAAVGKFGGAVSFTPASSQYLDFGNPASLKPSLFTISCWIKAAVTQPATSAMLIAACTNTTGDGGYNVYLSDIYQIRCAIKEAGYAWASTGAWGGAGLNDNAWHMVTAVFSGDSIYVYVDGAVVAPNTAHFQPVDYSGASPLVTIGSKPFATQSAVLYSGLVDEARVASCVQTSGWISTEYANQSAPTAFVVPGTPYAPGAYATPGGFYGGGGRF